MHTQWQNLNKVKRKKLLKKLFFDVLFHHENLPGFMTEEDWSDLFEKSQVDVLLINKRKDYCMVLFLETFTYRYKIHDPRKYKILEDFLMGPLAHVQVQDIDLFSSCSLENDTLWFKFNLQAVFL